MHFMTSFGSDNDITSATFYLLDVSPHSKLREEIKLPLLREVSSNLRIKTMQYNKCQQASWCHQSKRHEVSPCARKRKMP